MKNIILSALLLLIWSVVVSAQVDWRRPGSQREAVEGTPSNNRSRSESSRDNNSDRATREQARQRYNQKIDDANKAVKDGDYRLAARLFQEAVSAHEGLDETQSVQSARRAAEYFKSFADTADAAKAGDAARANGNYTLALMYYEMMLRHPEFDTSNNRIIVANIRERLRVEQARRAREADYVKLVVKFRKRISELAASLDTALPNSTRAVLTEDGVSRDPSGFGENKANVQLTFGDPTKLENLSEQGRQGFDTAGRLKGSEAVKVPTEATAREVGPAVPKRFSKHLKIVAFQGQWQAASLEIAEVQKALEDIGESRKQPNAKKEELDLQEVEAVNQLQSAQSKRAAAAANITRTVETLKFRESRVK